MNKERIIAIAEWLENGAVHVTPEGEAIGFDMNHWHGEVCHKFDLDNPEFPDHCGTAMCIGGAAEQFFGDGGEITNGHSRAAELLGLGGGFADQLFYPWGAFWYVTAGSQPLTPDYMAGVLRRLVDTGELIG